MASFSDSWPNSTRFVRKSSLIMTGVLLLAMLLSACSGDPQAQQQATTEHTRLNTSLAHAHDIGVPADRLAPIVKQEQALQKTSAPFSLFSDAPVTDYYHSLAQRYQQLTIEVTGLEAKVTQEFDYQAYRDIQDLESALAGREAQGFVETKTFATQLAQDQALLAQAHYPKDYLDISSSARRSTLALHLMGPVYDQLQSFLAVSQQLNASHVDITAFHQQGQDDLTLFRNAAQPEDFSGLMDQLNAHLQEAHVLSVQSIPYVGAYTGALKLKEYGAAIHQLQTYGENVKAFQQRFTSDQHNLATARVNDYTTILSQLDNDIAAIQIPLARGKANYYLRQFQHEVQVWGNRHQYQNPYDGQSYRLDYEYDTQGIGSDAQDAVRAAQTIDDYQAAVTLIQNDLANLKAMEADAGDATWWYHPHRTDLTLMQYYNVKGAGAVIVVSLVEQALRFYQNGRLVQAFQITTGQYARPSPPGLWNIFLRQHPTEFKSSEPPGSAFWYPPTKIEYAMEYHDGGYFLHDSWWRADYGPGTNFPHYDSGGDETFAGNGSHGCINMAPNDVAWLYQHTGYGVTVIVY